MKGSRSLVDSVSALSKGKKDRSYEQDDDDKDQPIGQDEVREGKRARVESKENAKGNGGIDEDEWARFQAEVLQSATANSDSPASAAAKINTNHNAKATIEAEPILHDSVIDPDEENDELDELNEGDNARRKNEREAHEEILSRFDEEQRAQEEADQRVKALKDRLEKFRQQRKANKSKESTQS